jgi:hypothetical protein
MRRVRFFSNTAVSVVYIPLVDGRYAFETPLTNFVPQPAPAFVQRQSFRNARVKGIADSHNVDVRDCGRTA